MTQNKMKIRDLIFIIYRKIVNSYFIMQHLLQGGVEKKRRKELSTVEQQHSGSAVHCFYNNCVGK